MRNTITLCFQLNVVATANNISVLPDVNDRLSLYIKNTGANPCILGFGSDASGGYILAAGENLNWQSADGCPNCYVQASQVGGLVTELSIIAVNGGR